MLNGDTDEFSSGTDTSIEKEDKLSGKENIFQKQNDILRNHFDDEVKVEAQTIVNFRQHNPSMI